MGVEAALTSSSDVGWERRARRLPWGIEIQIWRLVETKTYPDSAGNLMLSALLTESESTDSSADETVESHPVDDDVTLRIVELEYVGDDE
jgi:hypothetical protein